MLMHDLEKPCDKFVQIMYTAFPPLWLYLYQAAVHSVEGSCADRSSILNRSQMAISSQYGNYGGQVLGHNIIKSCRLTTLKITH